MPRLTRQLGRRIASLGNAVLIGVGIFFLADAFVALYRVLRNPGDYLLLVFPLVALALAIEGIYLTRATRGDAGQCRRCGYDTRVAPFRCPECGYRWTMWKR
jgi:hypothetical protein